MLMIVCVCLCVRLAGELWGICGHVVGILEGISDTVCVSGKVS